MMLISLIKGYVLQLLSKLMFYFINIQHISVSFHLVQNFLLEFLNRCSVFDTFSSFQNQFESFLTESTSPIDEKVAERKVILNVSESVRLNNKLLWPRRFYT